MPTTDDAVPTAKRICLVCHGEFSPDQRRCPSDGTILVALSADPYSGRTLADRYQVEELIGTGGTSMVYRAQHNQLQRTVAIKMLKAHLVTEEESKKRFEQEARAVSCLTHPHVVTIYDVGVTRYGEPYIVMEYLNGTSIAQFLSENGPMDWRRALPIFIGAASALSHAHKKTVIHRDVKPSNIMMVPTEEEPDFVKIVDFGMAKLRSLTGEFQRVTKTGEVFGSPAYMSPEQCTGRKLDERTDLYSLGVVMYEVLVGRPPFKERSAIETIRRHIKEAPPNFSDLNPDLNVPSKVHNIVFKCLAKSADDRYQTMDELKAALESVLEDETVDLSTRPGMGRAAATGVASADGASLAGSGSSKMTAAGPAKSLDTDQVRQAETSRVMRFQIISFVILILLSILAAIITFMHPFSR